METAAHVRYLLAERHSIVCLTQGEVMSLLTNFFKESDTQLGVFYPNHYLVAVFRNLETAQQVVKKLRLAGFAEPSVPT